ncbi:hypothetical protein HDU84_002061 [Entophlyctis sp. JEL0112]|nr:hypothetical protein HDU84_002061 [Entophlyctis sp. JEL0112]
MPTAAATAAVILVPILVVAVSTAYLWRRHNKKSAPAAESVAVPSRFKRLTSKGSPKLFLATMAQRTAFPHSSPFVLKLDCALRYARVDFEVRVVEHDQLPTEKIPVVHYDGDVLCDSQLIIRELVTRGVISVHPDAWLIDTDRAAANMLRFGLENFAYYRIVQERWAHPQNWQLTKREYFSEMPSLVFALVPDMLIRPTVVKMLYANGTSRYPEASMVQLMDEFWDNVSVILAAKKYFFSNRKMCIADFAAFGILCNIIMFKQLNPTSFASVSRHKNLVDFVGRMKGELYPEY